MDMQGVYEDLQKKIPTLEIKKDEIMAKHTSFKVGGKADILIKIKTIEELQYILKYVKEKEIPLTIIGNGSNLLVKDNGIRGITIKLDFNEIDIEENKDKFIITVGAGVKVAMLAIMFQKKEIAGFEFAGGIPGTMGGAIRMNAGAHGKEMKQIVNTVTCINKEGEIQTLRNEEIDFSYRHSRFKDEEDIIISAKLELEKGKFEDIKEKMDEYKKTRTEKQPLDMPSAGSTFKRGTNFITAKLIDESGLKGYTIGGAQVSLKHAGFIVNTGNATAKDILELIDYIIKVVYEKFGKIIELEVEVIGE